MSDSNTPATTLQLMERINLRHRRVVSLAGEVSRALLKALPDHVPRDTQSIVYGCLEELFVKLGVEVLTDFDRERLGLPPRGPDGWTAEEILALEGLRLEAMTRPLQMTIPASELPEGMRINPSKS